MSTDTTTARYFLSKEMRIIWRFHGEERHARTTYGKRWAQCACHIEDMEDREEITAEEGEPS